MMKVSFLLVLMMFTLTSFAQKTLTEKELLELAHAFVAAKKARQQPETTVNDIDAYLALLADEFVDEHVKFGVTISSKAELRDGMIAKMKDEVFYSDITIEQTMTGANVIFIKMTETGKVKPSHLDKVIEYESVNLISLEYNDNKLIKHIRRHHG